MASRLQQLITIPEAPATPVISKVSGGSRLGMLLEKEIPKIPEVPKAVQTFPSTMEMLAELQIDPFSLKADPKKAISSAWNTIKETVKISAPKILNLFKPVFPAIGISGLPQKKEISKEIGEKLEATAAVGHIVFSPISALFEGANEIPILGSVSKLISLPFIAIGEGGAKLAGTIVDELPISDEAKENIKPGMEEIFALAGQLALGKITHIADKKVKELKTKFGEKDAQTIVNKANELSKQANEPVAETLKKEPTPIDISKVPPKMKMGELREAAIQREFEVPEFGKEVPEPKPTRKYVEVPREQLPVKPIEGMEFEMEKGVSALEARMKGVLETENVKRAKAEAEAKGLDVSIYDKMNKAEQLRMSAKYVERTPQYEVLEVLEGKREAPKGLLHNAIMLALEEKSLRDRNVDLAIKLASLRSTRMGQEISILTEVSGLSPVSGMYEIIRARRGVAEKKLKYGEKMETKKVSAVKEIKTEQTKFQLKMSEVSKFLEEITCK